jgi:hypothetical protein
MTKFEKQYCWCKTCNSWNLTHVSDAHRQGGTDAAPTPAPTSATAPEVAGMVAPMANDFSLVQLGGFMCSPTNDAWHDAAEDDETSIPLKD